MSRAAAARAPASPETAPAEPASGKGRHGKRRVPDARDKWVHVRCNSAEHAAIIAGAAQAGLDAGPYLRSLALGSAGPRARRQPAANKAELVRVLGLLGNYTSNLNQLAHVANANGALPTEAALIEIAQHVRTLGSAVMQALGSPPARGQADGD